MLKAMLVYLGCVSLLLFVLMGADKRAAIRGSRRVPETTLLALAVVGGAAGGLLGMLAFRHKTRKPAFSAGLPVILLIQIALVWWIIRLTS